MSFLGIDVFFDPEPFFAEGAAGSHGMRPKSTPGRARVLIPAAATLVAAHALALLGGDFATLSKGFASGLWTPPMQLEVAAGPPLALSINDASEDASFAAALELLARNGGDVPGILERAALAVADAKPGTLSWDPAAAWDPDEVLHLGNRGLPRLVG